MAQYLWPKALEVAKDTKIVYLVLLSLQSSCCGNLFQLCRRLFPEDPLQQDIDVCRLWGSLEQYCQTTIPKTTHMVFVSKFSNL